MAKKMMLAVLGLVIAFALASPPKASAQVGIGIGIGVPYGGYVYGCDPYYYPAGCYAPYGYAWGGPYVGWYGGGYGWGGYGWRGGYYGRGYYGGYGHGYYGGYGRGYGGYGGHAFGVMEVATAATVDSVADMVGSAGDMVVAAAIAN